MEVKEQLRDLGRLLSLKKDISKTTLKISFQIILIATVVRSYIPFSYYVTRKLVIGLPTKRGRIMRIRNNLMNDIYICDFVHIYKFNKTPKPIPLGKQSSFKNLVKPTAKQTTKQIKRDIRKSSSKKRSNNIKIKLKSCHESLQVSATRVSRDFEIDPQNNIYYILESGFFKESLYILKKTNKVMHGRLDYKKTKRLLSFDLGDGNRVFCVNPFYLYDSKNNKFKEYNKLGKVIDKKIKVSKILMNALKYDKNSKEMIEKAINDKNKDLIVAFSVN